MAQLQPNELGLYDMSGNVWEWCEDYRYSNYEGAQNHGSAWLVPPMRVHCGGSWRASPGYCRAARRYDWLPGFRNRYLGFRLALSLQSAGSRPAFEPPKPGTVAEISPARASQMKPPMDIAPRLHDLPNAYLCRLGI